MISPKHLFLSLSGFGTVGLLANLATLNSVPTGTTIIGQNLEKASSENQYIQTQKPLWEQDEVKNKCGNDNWSQSSWDSSDPNWDKYRECLIKHLSKKK